MSDIILEAIKQRVVEAMFHKQPIYDGQGNLVGEYGGLFEDIVREVVEYNDIKAMRQDVLKAIKDREGDIKAHAIKLFSDLLDTQIEGVLKKEIEDTLTGYKFRDNIKYRIEKEIEKRLAVNPELMVDIKKKYDFSKNFDLKIISVSATLVEKPKPLSEEEMEGKT